MDGGQYAELVAFIAISETRSFRKAALRLGVTSSAISRTLRRLEDRLGLRLLNRTTRSVSSTEAGASLYAKLVPAAIASLEEAVDKGRRIIDHNLIRRTAGGKGKRHGSDILRQTFGRALLVKGLPLRSVYKPLKDKWPVAHTA